MQRSVHLVREISLLLIYDHVKEEIVIAVRLPAASVDRLLREFREARMANSEAQNLLQRQGLLIPGFPYPVIEPDPVPA